MYEPPQMDVKELMSPEDEEMPISPEDKWLYHRFSFIVGA